MSRSRTRDKLPTEWEDQISILESSGNCKIQGQWTHAKGIFQFLPNCPQDLCVTQLKSVYETRILPTHLMERTVLPETIDFAERLDKKTGFLSNPRIPTDPDNMTKQSFRSIAKVQVAAQKMASKKD